MAQLIAFRGAPGSPGMPHVPGFQFWADRGLSGTTLVQPKPSPPGFTGFSQPFSLAFVVCGNNTAHAMVGASVQLFIAGSPVATFEFTETTAAPGNIAVVIVNGDTAAQCATALQNAINAWAAAFYPLAIAAAPATAFGFGTDTVLVATSDPSLTLSVVSTGTPVLAITNNNAQVYGDALLHRAWRVFVYQGVDPALVNVFPESDFDIALAFWPLHPLARKAFPALLANPWANAKPEPD